MEYDQFILEKTFPKLEKILAFQTKSVQQLTKDCCFVLDTNALLAPYQIGESAVPDLKSIYGQLADESRLFVPARVLREFGRNRSTAIEATFEHLNNARSRLPSAPQMECPLLEDSDIYKEARENAIKLAEAIKSYKKSLTALIGRLQDWDWSDEITQLYRDVFKGDCVVELDMEEKDIENDVEHRITHSIPPGYKDKGKNDRGIGDIVIWLTIKQIAKRKDRSVIFVCNETKPDWVVKRNDEVLCPRTELTYEFHQETAKQFGLISFPKFLEMLNASSKTVRTSKKAVPEVRKSRTKHRRNRSTARRRVWKKAIERTATPLVDFCERIQQDDIPFPSKSQRIFIQDSIQRFCDKIYAYLGHFPYFEQQERKIALESMASLALNMQTYIRSVTAAEEKSRFDEAKEFMAETSNLGRMFLSIYGEWCSIR